MSEPGPAAASPENAFAADLFEDLPPRYDRLAEVLSLGQNRRWRREVVRHIARFKPRRILDVATGTAGVAIALAHATEAEIVGIDISEHQASARPSRADTVPGGVFRRRHVHLPAALRRRPDGHAG